MNFDLSDEQNVVKDLARQIFEGHATVERVKDVERNLGGFDEALWRELAAANLLGLCLPEDLGGSGFGLVELCLLLEEQGRRVAPVPLWATIALGALPLAEFGTAEQQALLAGVITGELRLTAALSESGADDALRPSVTATRADAGWHLQGFKPSVPAAQFAHRILVPATHAADGAVGIFLVDPTSAGVRLEPVDATSHQPHAHVDLDTVVAAGDRLGGDDGDGAAQLLFLLERALVGLCAIQLGVCAAAIEQTAAYTSTRTQFGKPLSTFQGVAHQAADAFILTEPMRVTMLQAAWRLMHGLSSRQEVLIAKYWASEGGQKVVHLCQHLHGGMGADIDYPIHRYFLWGVQNETTLGAGSVQLSRLGSLIAADAGRPATAATAGGAGR
ncbi:MAG: acyl-CoA dehydrogenase [Ilumatobacteraceae bacterium]|nr:acyl-CoA dehydrogenase [Ilumatobacteraceae bacterium]